MASNIFTGASRYSQDFQSVIDRAVNIASLPMMQMQQSKATASDQASALKGLDSKVSALQTSLKAIGDSFGFVSYSVSNSDASILSAKIADGAKEGTYTVKVLDAGSYATATSKSSLTTVSDPATQNISTGQDFSLSINGGESKAIHASADNLSSLVEAINNANAGVRATVVNLSPSGTPEYHISLQSTTLGPITVSLKNGDTELMDAAVGGAQARYVVNGRAEESTSNSRTVTLSTGLTIDLVRDDTKAVTIAVTRGSTSVKSAIETFINRYNGVVDEMNKHYGDQKGALTGNSIVSSTAHVIRTIGSFAPSNTGMNSLASIGVLTDRDGKLYLDATEWDKVKNDFSGLQTFAGTLTGSGFVKSANDDLDTLQDAKTGILKTAITSSDEQATNADTRIIEEQRRIDDLRTTLQDRFAAVDALIAGLEQQASYFINLFAAMKSNQESMN
jgi:flagellar hook-associated protein 2